MMPSPQQQQTVARKAKRKRTICRRVSGANDDNDDDEDVFIVQQRPSKFPRADVSLSNTTTTSIRNSLAASPVTVSSTATTTPPASPPPPASPTLAGQNEEEEEGSTALSSSEKAVHIVSPRSSMISLPPATSGAVLHNTVLQPRQPPSAQKTHAFGGNDMLPFTTTIALPPQPTYNPPKQHVSKEKDGGGADEDDEPVLLLVKEDVAPIRSIRTTRGRSSTTTTATASRRPILWAMLCIALAKCLSSSTGLTNLLSRFPHMTMNSRDAPQGHRSRSLSHLDTGNQSVYVAGGGFSGFWYTLGRLHSLREAIFDRDYYCYSAGCLAVVAVFHNYTMEEMYEKASFAQREWLEGRLDRYDVVPTFVDSLLFDKMLNEDESTTTTTSSSSLSSWLNDTQILSKLHVLTSVRNTHHDETSWWQWLLWGGGVTPVVTQPASAQELRTLLLQTTWIPFAVGRDLWHYGNVDSDSSTDNNNNNNNNNKPTTVDTMAMDGGVSAWDHPKCAHTLNFAIDWDLIVNVINIHLGRDKVNKFWNMGLEYGGL